jgi:hypothetical protein
MAEERGFEVIDKRRVSADAPPASESEAEGPQAATAAPEEQSPPPAEAAEPAGETAAGEPEGAGWDQGPLPELDAAGVISLSINMLHEVAWVKLGLVPNPVTQKIEKDLAQARLAIDCAADLVRHLEPHVDANARRDLQNLISTLRMNFVQQSQR